MRSTSRSERPSTNSIDDEIGGAVFAPVEDGDDVGVAQVGRCLRLTPEAADKGVIGAVLGMENLDGHTPTEKNGSAPRTRRPFHRGL